MDFVKELLVVAGLGNVPQVESFLARGISVNASNFHRWTALHMAASSGEQAVVKILLDKGANPNMQTLRNMTPLHEAALNGYYAIVETLLNASALIELRDRRGYTALHWAVAAGRPEIVELLLKRDANINSKNGFEETSLHMAAFKGHYEIIDILLNRGAWINSQDRGGYTPLHHASEKGYHVIVEALLNKKARINMQSRSENAPRHLATLTGDKVIVAMHLGAGSYIDTKDRLGNTALHLASSKGREAVVRLLLHSNASINLQNQDGTTPLDEAVRGDYKPIIQQLLQQGAYTYRRKMLGRNFTKYWREPIDDIEANQAFYTTLLLAGLGTYNQILPKSLNIIRSNIELTVRDWLKPLNLSQATCREMTPLVLRALPRLLDWLDLIVSVKDSCNASNQSDASCKNYALSFFEAAQQESNPALCAKMNTKLPQELLDVVQEYFIQREFNPLVKFLEQAYTIPKSIGQYLVNYFLTYPDEYIDFRQRLFQHDWQTPCSPPVIDHTTQYAYQNLPLK